MHLGDTSHSAGHTNSPHTQGESTDTVMQSGYVHYIVFNLSSHIVSNLSNGVYFIYLFIHVAGSLQFSLCIVI